MIKDLLDERSLFQQELAEVMAIYREENQGLWAMKFANEMNSYLSMDPHLLKDLSLKEKEEAIQKIHWLKSEVENRKKADTGEESYIRQVAREKFLLELDLFKEKFLPELARVEINNDPAEIKKQLVAEEESLEDHLQSIVHPKAPLKGFNLVSKNNMDQEQVLSPDGQYVLTKGYGALVIRELATRQRINSIPFTKNTKPTQNEEIHYFNFHPNNQELVTVGLYTKDLIIWDIKSGQKRLTLPSPGGDLSMTEVNFSPDGHSLIRTDFPMYRSGTPIISLWNIHPSILQKIQQSLSSNKTYPYESFKSFKGPTLFGPTGTILTPSAAGGVRIVDIKTGQTLQVFEEPNTLYSTYQIDPKGEILATGAEDGHLVLWDIPSGNIIAHYQHHTKPITSIAFHPESQFVATGSEDSTIKIWDTKRQLKDPLVDLTDHKRPIKDIFFGQKGDHLYSVDQSTNYSSNLPMNVYTWELIK